MMNAGQTINCRFYLSIHRQAKHEVLWGKTSLKTLLGRNLLETDCVCMLFVPNRQNEWTTLKVGYQLLPTNSEARNGTGKFYTIFLLAEQKTAKFPPLFIGWARRMFGWAQSTPVHSYCRPRKICRKNNTRSPTIKLCGTPQLFAKLRTCWACS